MSLISLRQLLDHAAENNYGVPAFNVNNLEQIRAIMEGAKELNSPLLFRYLNQQENMLVQYFKKYGANSYSRLKNIPIVLHQDHGGSPEDCKNCIELALHL